MVQADQAMLRAGCGFYICAVDKALRIKVQPSWRRISSIDGGGVRADCRCSRY